MMRLILALAMTCMTSGCLSTMALASGAYTTLVEPKTVDGGRWGYVVRGDHVQFQEPQGSFLPQPGKLADLPGADAATFVVLDKAQTWAKDKARVFHRAEVLEGADPATFNLVSRDYVKDARTVWYLHLTMKDIPLAGANAATFQVLPAAGDDKQFSYSYATDGASVWMRDKKLEGVDAARFHVTASELGTDGQRSYYQAGLLPGVVGGVTLLNDYHSFVDSTGAVFFLPSRYSKASELVSVKVCDSASFRLVGVDSYYSPNNGPARFSADAMCAFFRGQKLTLTDRTSWAPLTGEWSKDKGAVFNGATRVPEIDAASVEIVKGPAPNFQSYLRDKSDRCWETWRGTVAECSAVMADKPPAPQH